MFGLSWRPGLQWRQSLQWIDMWRRAAAMNWGHVERLLSLHDPRELRAWWLADVRQLTSDYMRSPAFLALMRLNLTLLNQQMMIKATQMMSLPSR